MFLVNFWLVLVAFLSLKQDKNEGEFCATHGNELPSQSRDAKKRIKERNPKEAISHGDAKSSHAMRNSKGQQFQRKFGALFGVYCLDTIYHFESREVRSSTLQTVYNLELKRRSYGHLKETAPS